jgi:mono/diheme cytochrome c family protein
MDGGALRVFVIFGVLVLLGALGFFIWAKQPAIARISPPAASDFDQTTIAKGAMLVSMGDCAACHTAQGGVVFAGGYPVPTPFGTIYGSNITPDPQTGIGNWSEAAFLRAMHEGVARNGAYLYPAFPYDHFTLVSDDDAKAIYAYLMTRQPVHNVVPDPYRAGRVEPPVFAGGSLPARPDPECHVESRCLHCRGPRPLRCLPHAA